MVEHILQRPAVFRKDIELLNQLVELFRCRGTNGTISTLQAAGGRGVDGGKKR